MTEKYLIRNSTAEFLIFQIEGKEQGVEVYYKDENLWATQKAMSVLFDCSTDNVSLHLKNIYDTGELKQEATAEKISVVRHETSLPELAQSNGKAIHTDVQNVMDKLVQAFPNFGKAHAQTISNLLVACKTPSVAKDVMTACGLSSRTSFDRVYFGPIKEMGLVTPTYPDNPRHPQQKYYLTELGFAVLEVLKTTNE